MIFLQEHEKKAQIEVCAFFCYTKKEYDLNKEDEYVPCIIRAI